MAATNKQIEACELFHILGTPKAVANRLRITKSAAIKRLFGGAVNGLDICLSPDISSEVAPPGWSSYGKSILHKNGDVVMQWDKIRPDEQAIERLLVALENRTPVLPYNIKGPTDYRKDLMLEWKLFDQHHTMHAWGEQTGADYSIKHSEHLIKTAADKIFSEHGPVDTCVLVLGGDSMHTDNRSNKTEKSGHSLDVDTRYQKGLETFVYSMVYAIDVALMRANNVNVKVLSGNHDWHSAIAIAMILRAHYRENGRVTIDNSPMEHKFFRWDTSFFMYSHGDQAPPDRYATFATNYVIKHNITGIKRIYVRVGHIHTKKKIRPIELHQKGIAVVEYFDTLAAPDAYAAGAAFTSTRATTTDIFHRQWGKRGGMELSAEELLCDFAA